MPCPPPENLPNPGIKPMSLTFPTLAGGFFTTSATRKPSVYMTLHLPQQPREVLYTNSPCSAALQRSKVSVPGSHREAGPRLQCSLQSPLPFCPGPRVNRQDHAISSSIRRHREADILKVHGPDNRQNASETTSEAKWKEGGKCRGRGRADKKDHCWPKVFVSSSPLIQLILAVKPES